MAEIRLNEKISDENTPIISSFLTLIPLNICGKIKSPPKQTTDEKLIKSPIKTELFREVSMSPGTHDDKIASDKNIKNKIDESAIIFCHKGFPVFEKLNLRNIIHINMSPNTNSSGD